MHILNKRALATAGILLAFLYLGDYFVVRIKMAGSNSEGALGSIQIRRYWEIPSKSGKVEYSFDAPQMQTCVHSLFPHLGYTPCWYLNRNKLQRVARIQAAHFRTVKADAPKRLPISSFCGAARS